MGDRSRFPAQLLGLTHEHQRIDRDKYLKVMLENAFDTFKYAFIVDKNTTTFGVSDIIVAKLVRYAVFL